MPIPLLTPTRRLGSSNCNALLQPRYGIMLHFDDSSDDRSAVQWFTDPACRVSYNRLYLDDGSVVEICDLDRRAWHAGVCLRRPGALDANSAFYGLAAATDTRTPVTDPQFSAIVHDCVALFLRHGWGPHEAEERIVGHEDLAIFPDDYPDASKRGKLGRKIDPTGLRAAQPILSTRRVRDEVVRLLGDGTIG